jgi:hypothetical protein
MFLDQFEMEAEALSSPGKPTSIGFVNRYRWASAGVAVAVLIAAGIAIFTYESGLPSDIADGFYSNDCCGTLELRGGHMIANGVELVNYTVQQDDQGPYILPRSFIGTEDGGFVLDGDRRVRKLRLNALPSPNRISLPGLWRPDIFERTQRRTR